MKKVSFLTDPWILGTALVLLTLCIHLAPPLNSMLSMSTEQWLSLIHISEPTRPY